MCARQRGGFLCWAALSVNSCGCIGSKRICTASKHIFTASRRMTSCPGVRMHQPQPACSCLVQGAHTTPAQCMREKYVVQLCQQPHCLPLCVAGWHRPGGIPCDAAGAEAVGEKEGRLQQRVRCVLGFNCTALPGGRSCHILHAALKRLVPLAAAVCGGVPVLLYGSFTGQEFACPCISCCWYKACGVAPSVRTQ
jgi:hypothetical protein